MKYFIFLFAAITLISCGSPESSTENINIVATSIQTLSITDTPIINEICIDQNFSGVLEEITQRFANVEQLAQNTQRIQLIEVILKLQDIQNEFFNTSFPDCAINIKEKYMAYISKIIETYSEFMADKPYHEKYYKEASILLSEYQYELGIIKISDGLNSGTLQKIGSDVQLVIKSDLPHKDKIIFTFNFNKPVLYTIIELKYKFPDGITKTLAQYYYYELYPSKTEEVAYIRNRTDIENGLNTEDIYIEVVSAYEELMP